MGNNWMHTIHEVEDEDEEEEVEVEVEVDVEEEQQQQQLVNCSARFSNPIRRRYRST